MYQNIEPVRQPAHGFRKASLRDKIGKSLKRIVEQKHCPKHVNELDSDHPTLALLIDAENISLSLMDKVFEEAFRLGCIKIRRAYGVWNNNSTAAKYLPKYAIDARYIACVLQGKNAADIAMAADAVDICYTDPAIDGFIIVSSDSDFTALSVYLRNSGKTVFGIGSTCSSELYKESCDKFIPILLSKRKKGRKKILSTKDSVQEEVLEFIRCSNGKTTTSAIAVFIRKELGVQSIKSLGYKKVSAYLKQFEDLVVIDDKVKLMKY